MFRVVGCVLSAVVLLVAAAAGAQESRPVKEVKGCVIVEAGGGKITIAKGGNTHSAAVASDADITCDGKKCKLEDLRKDQVATLTMTKVDDMVRVLRIAASSK